MNPQDFNAFFKELQKINSNLDSIFKVLYLGVNKVKPGDKYVRVDALAPLYSLLKYESAHQNDPTAREAFKRARRLLVKIQTEAMDE